MNLKKQILTLTVLAVSMLGIAEIDITDRTQTDPLLKIKTLEGPSIDEANKILFEFLDPTNAKLQPDRIPVSYKRLWGKKDVIMIHPLTRTKPALMDFSKITASHGGTLKIYIKNHKAGNHQIKIRLGDKTIETETINKGKWISFRVKFDHQPLQLEVYSIGEWNCEQSFISYRISTS